MSAIVRSVSPPLRPSSPVMEGVKEGLIVSSKVITDIDGLYYISELVLSVFDMVEKLGHQAPVTVNNTIKLFRGYMDLTNSFELINRAKDWATKDKKGRYIWQRPFSNFAYNVSLTTSDTMGVISLMDQFNFIKLGSLTGPVNALYTASTLGMCVFNIWDSARSMHKARFKLERSRVRILKWQILELSSVAEFKTAMTAKSVKWANDTTERGVKKRIVRGRTTLRNIVLTKRISGRLPSRIIRIRF
jgi:hypothetical protein